MSSRVVIDSFTQAAGYGFLSNFYSSTIAVDGKYYPTVEHAYQSHKTLDESSRDLIRRASTPQQAKKLGRALIIRNDWEDVRVPLMRKFLIEKFDNPLLRPKLIATGDAELIYKNTWNDTFWGVCRGVGTNWLGRLLMEVREVVRNQNDEDQRLFLTEKTE